MTRYEQGFMNKCAEYGMDTGTSMRLMNAAQAGVLAAKSGYNTGDGAHTGITAVSPTARHIEDHPYQPEQNPSIYGAAQNAAYNIGGLIGGEIQSQIEAAKSIPSRFRRARQYMGERVGPAIGSWIGNRLYGNPNG